jgi:hypothetical protein
LIAQYIKIGETGMRNQREDSELKAERPVLIYIGGLEFRSIGRITRVIE